jgi:DNA-directed RNA polymerase specialized sigma24 family protein
MTFDEFAAARLPALLRFTAVLAGNRATAEDLAQEVLIRAHAQWDRIGAMDSPEHYVRQNAAAGRLRRAQPGRVHSHSRRPQRPGTLAGVLTNHGLARADGPGQQSERRSER